MITAIKYSRQKKKRKKNSKNDEFFFQKNPNRWNECCKSTVHIHRDIVYQRRHTHSHIHKMLRCDEIAQKQFRMIYYRIECLRCLFSFHSFATFFFQKKNELFFLLFLYEYIDIKQKRLPVVCVQLLVCACLSMYSNIHNTYMCVCMLATASALYSCCFFFTLPIKYIGKLEVAKKKY